MSKIVGVGGVFLSSKDPEALYSWYETHLGIQRKPGEGVCFPWKGTEEPHERGMTVWCIFKQGTSYFGPGPQTFMLNYLVSDLDAMLVSLQAKGVAVLGKEDSEYGRFAWIADLDGNRVELWEAPRGT